MPGLPYPLETILHEMRGLFIPIWLCLAKIDEVEMFVKAQYFLILGLDIIGRYNIDNSKVFNPVNAFMRMPVAETGTSMALVIRL